MTKRDNPEARFTSQVIDLLHWYGWLVYHPLPAVHRGRYVTAMQGDKGWPDIAAAHPVHGFIVAELKTATGRVTTEQKEWLHALLSAGVEAYIWRPDDMDFIASRAKGVECEI